MNANQLAIAQEFVRKLGDASQYDFTGEVIDCGRVAAQCTCGHPIRYIYVISDGKQTANVGSECINHFKSYNPRLFEKLSEAHQERLEREKEEKRKAKEAREQAEVQELESEYKKIVARVKELYPEGLPWLPEDLYFSYRNRCFGCKKSYKRASSYIKWYKEFIPLAKEVVESIEQYYNDNPPRKPEYEPEPLATEKQKSYLKHLCKVKGYMEPNWDTLTKNSASLLISDLKYKRNK